MLNVPRIHALKLPISALQLGATGPEALQLHHLLGSGFSLTHASAFVDKNGDESVLAVLMNPTAKQPNGGGDGPTPTPSPNPKTPE